MKHPHLDTLLQAIILGLMTVALSVALVSKTQAAEPNLLPNGDLLQSDPTNEALPLNWRRGGWGTNTPNYNYPVPGVNDTAAVQVTLTTHTSGDAKWYTNPVPVTAGDNYLFTDQYKATVPTIITAEYHLSSGAIQYQYLLTLPAASTWTEARTNLTIPPNVISATIYHLLDQIGDLTFDTPTLTKNDPITPPPPDPENLIANGSFETTLPNDANTPQGWSKSRWGTNQANFIYPVTGNNSVKAAAITISSHTSGDAKWSFPPIATTTARTLIFRDYYKATAQTHVTVDYLLNNGSHRYVDIAILPPAPDWTQAQISFTPPEGIQSLTIYHLLNRIGTLTIDSAHLSVAHETIPPPPDPANLIVNANVNQASPINPQLPLAWSKGNWGTNQAVLKYPVAGTAGMNGLEVSLTSHTTGDAKWTFDPIPVTPGLIYRYAEYYKATIPSIITARYDFAGGISAYADLMRPNPASEWTLLQASVSPPSGTQKMTILHRINQVGTLTTSGFLLPQPSASSTSAFSEGMVTLTFDDGHISAYDVARSRLHQAGIKASFYLMNDYLTGENPFYMSTTQALALNNDGHEIGGHSRTHPFLTQLNPTQLRDETIVARQELLALGFTPVDTFVYPYGDYNNAVIDSLKTAGYIGARSVQPGFNDKLTDPFLLMDQHIESDTTPGQVQTWINQAKANKTWLILELHQQNDSGNQYSNTPETLQAIIDSIKNSQIKTVTLHEGLRLMQQ